MIRDEFDKLFGDIEFQSDAEVRRETTNLKIKNQLTGRKAKACTEENKKKLSKKFKGKPRPAAVGQSISAALNNRTEKQRAAHTAKVRERLLNMSEKQRAEVNAKISAAKKGVPQKGGNFKHIKTPHGVFTSLTAAGKYEEKITGRKFNPNRFTKLINTLDSGYIKISKEEYEKLKKP